LLLSRFQSAELNIRWASGRSGANIATYLDDHAASHDRFILCRPDDTHTYALRRGADTHWYLLDNRAVPHEFTTPGAAIAYLQAADETFYVLHKAA